MSEARRRVPASWRFLVTTLAGVVILISAQVAAVAAPASAYRDFDAVTTANENHVWKHMALIGDQYVIFNDYGIIQGPASIRGKWPFLPEQFTHDVDSAAVSFSGPGFRWRNTFTKGSVAIVFEDSGIVSGPTSIPSPYDGLSDLNRDGESRIFHLAVRGGNYATFWGYDYTLPTTPLSDFRFLPERFQHDLDDVSLEYESIGAKYSFYQGNERIIFDSRGNIMELATLDYKWPFLNGWRAAMAKRTR